MDDPWGSSLSLTTTSTWARDDTTSPTSIASFPSLPAPAILTRDRQPSPLHLAPPSSHSGTRPNTPGQLSQSLSQAQTPWGADLHEEEGWGESGVGLGSTVWATASQRLRRRASTRTSLSPSLSPSLGNKSTSPRLGPIGREPSPDPWARSSPVPSDGGGWGEGYVLRKFGDSSAALEDLTSHPWGRDSVDGPSRRASLAGFAYSYRDDSDNRSLRVNGLPMLDSRRASFASRRSKSPAPSMDSRVIEEVKPKEAKEVKSKEAKNVKEASEIKGKEVKEINKSKEVSEANEVNKGKEIKKEELGDIQEQPETESVPASPPPPPPPKRTRHTVDIAFPVDFALIDELFPDTPPPQPTPATLSSTDPRDSFGTSREKTVWKRVSRNQSLWRYKATTLDARVAWDTSLVHDEAIAIVRRWLEDATSGRKDGFGGGRFGGGGRMFNWDSSSAPVSLDELFGPRRNSSREVLSPTADTPTSSVPSRSLSSPSFGDDDSQVARFSWSTCAGSTISPATTTVPPSPLHPEKPKSRSYAQNWSLSAPPGSVPLATPKSKQIAITVPKSEDEDEWGEMVSTPAEMANEPEAFVWGVDTEKVESPVKESFSPMSSSNSVFSPVSPVKEAFSPASPIKSTPVSPTKSTFSPVSPSKSTFSPISPAKSTPASPTKTAFSPTLPTKTLFSPPPKSRPFSPSPRTSLHEGTSKRSSKSTLSLSWGPGEDGGVVLAGKGGKLPVPEKRDSVETASSLDSVATSTTMSSDVTISTVNSDVINSDETIGAIDDTKTQTLEIKTPIVTLDMCSPLAGEFPKGTTLVIDPDGPIVACASTGDEEALAMQILDSLPDLSYMLH